MNKGLRRLLLVIWVVAGIYAGWQGIQKNTVSLDSLLGFCTAAEGRTISGWYEGKDTVIARIEKSGAISGTYRFRTVKKSVMYNIRGMAAGDTYTYMLRDKRTPIPASSYPRSWWYWTLTIISARKRRYLP